MSEKEPVVLASGESGRNFYDSKYRTELDTEAEWLSRSARQKADSVERLLSAGNIRPESILELGCGTGALLVELQKRKIADHVYGLDYSSHAIEYVRRVAPAIQVAAGDVTDFENPFDRDSFDVIVLSHTLEHLEQPMDFLRAIHSIKFTYLVIEVPLENLFFGRIKAAMIDRSANPAGHVQFFSGGSFRKLVSEAGYQIIDQYRYAPVLDAETFRFAYSEKGIIRRVHKWLTERALPNATGPLWIRVYHAHCALLCQPL